MSFDAANRLWFLAPAAALAAAYVVGQLQRRPTAGRFASPALFPTVAPRRPGFWRHMLALGLLGALALSSVAYAQPRVPRKVPRKTATIVLVIDISDSMMATDVSPSRLVAAEKAAQRFVDELPATFELGLVTAGPGADVVVPPTLDHASVTDALGRLKTRPGTALGEAIFAALGTLPPDQPTTGPLVPRAARIVLLSDGISTTGRPDSEAIAAAKAARVPISTISFGTSNASVLSQGQRVSVPVDRSAMTAIAAQTGGTTFGASTLTQLRSVYDKIGVDVRLVIRKVNIAGWFMGAAIALLFLTLALSMGTTGRVAL